MTRDEVRADFEEIGEDYEIFEMTAGTKLDKALREASYSSDAVTLAFWWKYTKQGYIYWRDIFAKLDRLEKER